MTTLKWTPLLFAVLLLAGCSTTITNLTPSKQARNPNGLYLFEVALDSNQQTLRKETLKPYVIIGLDPPYPMVPAPVLKNRWETLVPVPADQKYVNYQYKFDYDYNSFPRRGNSSKRSAPYQLEIVDK